MTTLVADGPQTRPTVDRLRGYGAKRTAAEAELTRSGIVLPLPQRAEWAHAQNGTDSVLFVVKDSAGKPLAAASGNITRTRALPGHHLYRFERLGSTRRPEADAALISAIANAARRDQRCLRVVTELFDRNTEARQRLATSLQQFGFDKLPRARNYDRTLGLDLGPTEEELFKGFNSKARRDARAPGKKGMVLRTVEQPALAARVQELMEESFKRTGAVPPHQPWANIIELSARNPSSSRVIGLFDGKTEGPQGLVAFAWGCVHGAYATYEAGASTRRPDLGSTPLGYAPLWDLIAWARGTTAEWFDFGGVTAGVTTSGDDALGGISDFKRAFCDQVVEVGEDWILEPHPLRARIARTLSATAKWAGRLAKR